MPGNFPFGLDICSGTAVGADETVSKGTAITTGAANTMGSFTQLTASLSRDCCAVICTVSNITTGKQAALDIAVGGSGSEVVVINTLLLQEFPLAGMNHSGLIPINIPSGTRVSARAQSPSATDTVFFSLVALDGAFTQLEGCAGVDAVGFLSSATTGTTVDPGGSANTKGSYSQLTASTARDYIGLIVDPDGLTGNPSNGNNSLMDVAIGGAGSETIILSNYPVGRTLANGAYPSPAFFPIQIPSGTRLSARSQSAITLTPARTFGLTLYGVYQ